LAPLYLFILWVDKLLIILLSNYFSWLWRGYRTVDYPALALVISENILRGFLTFNSNLDTHRRLDLITFNSCFARLLCKLFGWGLLGDPRKLGWAKELSVENAGQLSVLQHLIKPLA